jgi:hypothetical protein
MNKITHLPPISVLTFVVGLIGGVSATALLSQQQISFTQPSHQVSSESVQPTQQLPSDNKVSNHLQRTVQQASFIAPQLYQDNGQMVTGNVSDWQHTFQALTRPGDQEQFMMNLIEANMRQSPEKVLAFLEDLKPSRVRSAAIERALTIYAETEPENALKQAGRLLQGSEANNAYVEIAHVWGANNPAEALAWVSQQPENQLSFSVLENVVSAATQFDPNQMRSLINNGNLSDSQTGLAARALAGVWSQTSPNDATAWAKEYAAKTGDSKALASAYLNWATQDPAKAVVALKTETGKFSSGLAPEIAEIWSSQNPKSAAQWATNLPGDQRNTAIGNVAQTWASSDPEGALKWAASLSQDNRKTALQNIALRWSVSSPQAFEQKLATLPSNLQQELRSGLTVADKGHTAVN